jgi:predicted lipoprotein
MRFTAVNKVKRISGCWLLVFIMAVLPACTVVKIGEQAADSKGVGSSSHDTFDADAFVAGEWSKVVPYMEKHAADASQVLAALSANTDQAGEKYGIRNEASGSPWNFIVKAQGKVLAVHTESRAGTLELDLPPYDNKADILVQIGPVYKGSAIRDSLDFIRFDDFRNQIQYAQLANAFNKKINEEVIGKLDLASLKDRKIELLGAFAAGSSPVLLTPVRIQAVEGGR